MRAQGFLLFSVGVPRPERRGLPHAARSRIARRERARAQTSATAFPNRPKSRRGNRPHEEWLQVRRGPEEAQRGLPPAAARPSAGVGEGGGRGRGQQEVEGDEEGEGVWETGRKTERERGCGRGRGSGRGSGRRGMWKRERDGEGGVKSSGSMSGSVRGRVRVTVRQGGAQSDAQPYLCPLHVFCSKSVALGRCFLQSR